MVVPSTRGLFKLNIDGAARGKLGPECIGGVLWNDRRVVLVMFSKSMGFKNLNEAEILEILKALQIFIASFHGRPVVESDLLNAMGGSWLKVIH